MALSRGERRNSNSRPPGPRPAPTGTSEPYLALSGDLSCSQFVWPSAVRGAREIARRDAPLSRSHFRGEGKVRAGPLSDGIPGATFALGRSACNGFPISCPDLRSQFSPPFAPSVRSRPAAEPLASNGHSVHWHRRRSAPRPAVALGARGSCRAGRSHRRDGGGPPRDARCARRQLPDRGLQRAVAQPPRSHQRVGRARIARRGDRGTSVAGGEPPTEGARQPAVGSAVRRRRHARLRAGDQSRRGGWRAGAAVARSSRRPSPWRTSSSRRISSRTW